MSLRRLLRQGLAPHAAPLERQHVVFLHGLCLLAIGFTAITVLLSSIYAAGSLTGVVYGLSAGIGPPMFSLWLSTKGRHAAAAVIFALYTLLSTAGAVSLFGPIYGLQYWYMPVIVLTFMLFPSERRRTALAVAGLNAAAFLGFCFAFAVVPAMGAAPEDVRSNFQINMSLVAAAMAVATYYAQRVTARTRDELRALRGRTDALLGTVLPAEFVATLREGGEGVGRRHPQVSIVVCDIAGFTRLAEEAAAEDIVRVLNATFSAFDAVCKERGADKVKTVGDAYVAAVGLSGREPSARAAVDLALRMRAAVERAEACQARAIRVRIGVGTGEVIAGVVGTNKLAYDMWGAAIEAAFAMEERATPEQVVVDAATWAELTAEERAAVVRGEPEGYRSPATVG
ncbi:adenylate/guanylate cyclase domain-containing protein [Nannocystis bainbridge]|uniref:Adenylate/guanylate cyclase domain-containing protein n=1 Tax=Nannocystis bainbridge TaxID=2995303 RepID=A0ABT5DZF4_9BACT|nr:adenylate/guanylate cyclase domain-containing protein [Nannocystis bainbridge]MDC0717827.1 adenylate/guanylate cyclase domain-containing protein [Nannocystis bainbridge]